jgi:pimeloyl-ACP methyl ester carboxylesterase
MSTTCDRLRKRRLTITDALVPALIQLSGPVHGIRCPRDVHYDHRLPLIGQVMSRVPGFLPLDLLPQAGHWAQFEAADAFNDVLAKALLAHGRSAGG